jgi:glycine oxidase
MQADCVIIGAGVVGLSLAYELVQRNWQVTVLDKGQVGKGTSWAGAGILPPANLQTATHPLEQLRGWSQALHPLWAEQLLTETGIDTGFRKCGGVYAANTAGEAAALVAWVHSLQEELIACERWDAAQLMEHAPGLKAFAESAHFRLAYYLPDECQLRNPRHLQALHIACRQRGVQFLEQCEVQHVEAESASEKITGVQTNLGMIQGKQFCFTAGAWTSLLLNKMQVTTHVFPVRGQMLLFHSPQPILKKIFNVGSRYAVPREDGHLLFGSTEEEVGFDTSTTEEALQELQHLAYDWLPELRHAVLLKSWSGLRPQTLDGLPYIGRLPNMENGYVAAGHFRSGLHLSPATAVCLANLLENKPSPVNVALMHVYRH